MPRPRTEVVVGSAPSPRVPPTSTGKLFATGLTAKGPEEPTAIYSLTDFVRQFGDRQSYSPLYDTLDCAFREGLGQAYISRVLGAAADYADVELSDSTPAATLRIRARDKGLEGNSLNVQTIAGDAGGTFRLIITHDTDGELVRSPDLADKPAAIAWAEGTEVVRAVDLAGTGDPAVAASVSLSGGTDDRAAVTEAEWTAALARFERELGPGQVAAPGRSTTAAHSALLAHAGTFNRVALLDGADTDVNATLTAAVSSQRAVAGDSEKDGGLFAPWLEIPGLVPGTTRTVPPCALVAGLISRSDATSDAGEPAAGPRKGTGRFVTGVRAVFDNADHDTLTDGGVNVFRLRAEDRVVLEGFRTLADQNTYPDDWQLSQARALMQVIALAEGAALPYLFAQVDGRRRKLAELEASVAGEMLDLYTAGALYGDSPDEAYDVDARSNEANPIADLRQGIVRVLVSARVSPFAELIKISVTKVPISEPVA